MTSVDLLKAIHNYLRSELPIEYSIGLTKQIRITRDHCQKLAEIIITDYSCLLWLDSRRTVEYELADPDFLDNLLTDIRNNLKPWLFN